ncbi:hypothetical protein ACNQVK_04525 [Mycobacterium sp. 134]|uniref:hypothetical protein n=1 Tax=Mycobacteriaceae TaxID=1762 RepID=UPI003AAD62B7
MTNNNTDGWIPPRGGGYRPGKNTSTSTASTGSKKSATPPKGGAGVSKASRG